MDFAALPPEINSGRMYVGPGSGPMLAAAAAWDQTAGSLYSAATSYQAEVAALTAGPWLGPASASMAAAAAHYVEWTRATAALAELTANQARAAAVAYETAFAETVPPPVIAANRSLLMALIATNIFGQNTPAIATTETQYAEMWAQDAAAMYGYAGASASATTIAPFNPPPQSTNSVGTAGQAAAVAQATDTAAGQAQSAVSSAAQAFSAVPGALTGLATPAQGIFGLAPLDVVTLLADVNGIFNPYLGTFAIGVNSGFGSSDLPFAVGGALTGLHSDDIVSGWAGVEGWPGEGPATPLPFPVISGALGESEAAGGLGESVSAGLGEANTVGALSVPSGWAAAAPEIRRLAIALPATSVGAAAEASTGSAGSLFSQMALASMVGRATAGTGGAGGPDRREQTGATKREPTAEPQARAGGPITSIAAELRELASRRDAGILTNEEFTRRKKRLLAH
ncbi:MAG TPA: PPE domain-containing protein [Mycobacterium sp.]|nr:PPE domain-containing protein [Mycobacterium sp.]